MNYKNTAQQIIEACGGENNITQYWHCITRLRFNLVDEKKVDTNKFLSIEGVLGSQFQNGQFQVIIGNNVSKVYDELSNLLVDKSKEANGAKKKTKVIDSLIDIISGVFNPILPAIVGAGLLKGILVLLVVLNVISAQSTEYNIIYMISDVPFYFLPFLIAITSARKFKTNEFLALSLVGVLLYPTMVNAVAAGEITAFSFFGIPVPVVNYSGSVIPAILGVWLMSRIYNFINKRVPDLLKIILTPVLVLLITVPIELIVIAPIGNYAGIFIQSIFAWLTENTGPIAGIIAGGLMPLIIMTGMHYAFFPGALQSISQLGYDPFLLPINIIVNIAQAGAVFGVVARTKNKKFRSMAASTGISALLGVTEPAIYGVTLKLKKPFYSVLIGGALGGGFITLFHVKAFGFAVPGITSLPLYVNAENPLNLVYILIGVGISFISSFIITYIWKFDDIKEGNGESANITKGELNIQETVISPINGNVVPLSKVPDATFSDGVVGNGVAIMPKEGLVTAPFDGIVSMIPNTKHAIGLKSYTGLELLIHVGLETVQLNGEYFEMFVKEGQTIKKGDALLKFDIKALEAKGINLLTPVIITNSQDYMDVIATNNNKVLSGKDELLKIIK